MRVGGVLTGEHGVGIEKRDLMGVQFTEIDLDQQMRVKCAFDPDHLLNPGKVFPKLRRCAELGRVVVHHNKLPVSRHPAVLIAWPGTIKPRRREELRQAVEWALNDGATLDVRGSGSKLGARQADAVRPGARSLGHQRHRRLRARGAGRHACAPARRCARSRRCWPSATRCWPSSRPISARCSAAKPGEGTLVGAVMGNLAGPRRLSAGAARDHLLGFSGVNGRGEAFKSGGRVMKNVTGYDLSKLLAGSWGTLAVLDEVSVKVLPAPDQTRTLLLLGLDDEPP